MLMATGMSGGAATRCTAQVAAVDTVPAMLAGEWTALAGNAAEPNAFAEAWYAIPALAHLREGRTVRLVAARDCAGALAALLPLAIAERHGRIPVRHVGNWVHYQCFMGTPLIRTGAEQAAWQAVLRLLDKSDWGPGFLTVAGLLEDGPVHRGLAAAAAALDRPCPTVHRFERATLAGDEPAERYLERTIRAKKRKELRRLANRLADAGTVRFSVLKDGAQLPEWCAAFERLEASGWKGRDGAAFANRPETRAFFRAVMAGAWQAGRLDFQRLDLDGRPIAMLINFRTPPGSWSFKIAYDEALARFSPGVLIELENLPRVLADPAVDWMDSCAAADHPMINSLWGERRAIVQVSVPLAGFARRLTFAGVRAAERAAAGLRGRLQR